jgi:hypothetical protein
VAGKIIADTIEASGSQISLNVGNVTVLTASSTGLATANITTANIASISGAVVATQANPETATSTSTLVTPGRQQFHPSAAKVWLKCNISGTIQSSYNTTSVTDVGNGLVNVTIDIDFSNADYAILGTTFFSTLARVRCATVIAQAVGTFNIASDDEANGRQDPEFYYFVCFGDQ